MSLNVRAISIWEVADAKMCNDDIQAFNRANLLSFYSLQVEVVNGTDTLGIPGTLEETLNYNLVGGR